MPSDSPTQSTLDEVPIGIAHTSLDGQFILVNRCLCELLGYTPDELTAIDLFAISHEDDVGHDVHERDRLITGRLERYSRAKRYRRKDGRLVWANLTLSLHRDTAGVPYFIAVIEDLTERRYLEQRLSQAHKMEAAVRSAARIGHDLNNLLTAIDGFADLALEQIGDRASAGHDLEQIRAAVGSAGSLTRQLLDLSGA